MKGIESALTAAKSISTNFPNFKLFVVGDGDANYIEELKKYVTLNGLQRNVEFLGKISNKQRNTLYSKCHFLIHPSFKEGFGLTVLEAAASGTPTIARSGSSMNELIKHGVNGLLFDHDDQISQFLLNIMDHKHIRNLLNLQLFLAKI